jgi:cytochrome c oxidase subunit II
VESVVVISHDYSQIVYKTETDLCLKPINNLYMCYPALVAMCALAAITAAQISSPPASNEIKVTAQKYAFSPDVIHVKKDEHVKLVITALDAEHGFKLEAFGIHEKLKKGEATPIEFTASQAGTFPFQCSHFCGRGHGKMKGQLVVE